MEEFAFDNDANHPTNVLFNAMENFKAFLSEDEWTQVLRSSLDFVTTIDELEPSITKNYQTSIGA